LKKNILKISNYIHNLYLLRGIHEYHMKQRHSKSKLQETLVIFSKKQEN